MLKFAQIFQNNMVLQQKKPVAVWGTASPLQDVRVTVQDRSVHTTVLEDGTWHCMLPELHASLEETMTVTAADEIITIQNVAVGEVWLAGGQSNMEFLMHFDADYKQELEHIKELPIRYYETPKISFEGEEKIFDYSTMGFWRCCNSENLEWFSAVAYYFAKNLNSDLNVPIGIIGCSWGGTRCCCWMPENKIIACGGKAWIDDYNDGLAGIDVAADAEAYKANPMNDPTHPFGNPINEMLLYGITREEQLEMMKGFAANSNIIDEDTPKMSIGTLHPWRPGALYNLMLKKIAGYTITGVIYYQGESDDEKADIYEAMLTQLIDTWRDTWHDAFPFIIVQLAPFMEWLGCKGSNYPKIRRAQQNVSRNVENVWMASIGDIGMKYDIHPKKKRPVGERLALLAKGHVYRENILCDAPECEKAEWIDDQIVLFFKNVHEFRMDENKIFPVQIFEGEEKIETENYEISVKDNQIVIHLIRKLQKPVTVKFAETDYYEVNLFNEARIPVLPFVIVLE